MQRGSLQQKESRQLKERNGSKWVRAVSLFEIVTFLGVTLTAGLNSSLLSQSLHNRSEEVERVVDLVGYVSFKIRPTPNDWNPCVKREYGHPLRVLQPAELE